MTFKTSLLIAATLAVAMPALAETQTVVTKEVTASPGGSTTTTTTRYYYDDTDANNNGILDSNEFVPFVYNSWDSNGDGFITDDEWSVNTVRWYPSGYSAYKTYSYWDKDGDKRLDPNEFGTVVTTTKLYDTWDANDDKILESDEYAARTFSIYDKNSDGSLNLKEWQESRR